MNESLFQLVEGLRVAMESGLIKKDEAKRIVEFWLEKNLGIRLSE